MSKFEKSQLTDLFGSFLNDFLEDHLVYKDTLLTKTMVLPKIAGSVNAFAYDTADFIFKKKDKCGDINKTKFEKTLDFSKQYCNFVRTIKIDEEWDNFFLNEKYVTLSEQIKDWGVLYGEALFDLVENKKLALKSELKFMEQLGWDESRKTQELNSFLEDYRDPANAAKMDQATDNLKGLKIEREKMILESGVPQAAFMVYDARITCNDMEKHDAKNMNNMLVEGSMGTGGWFEPMIRVNKATLLTIGESLELSKAAQYANKIKEGEIVANTFSNGKMEKYANEKLPKGATTDVNSKKEAYDKKYADCAKKGYSNKNCEIELELIEKAFFTHKHDAQYEKYKAESEARREKNLERFEKFDEDDKMEQCTDNNYVKYFSSNSLKSHTSSSSISGNYLMFGASAALDIEDTKQTSDSSCISFASVSAIPLQYTWLNKDLYALNLKDTGSGVHLDMEHWLYHEYKDFILDRCIVAKSVIVGAGMRAHFKKNVLEMYDLDSKVSAEVGGLFWSAKAETQNGYSNYDKQTGGFDIYEPDLLVVLGYELENLCDKLHSTYLQEECPNYHYEL